MRTRQAWTIGRTSAGLLQTGRWLGGKGASGRGEAGGLDAVTDELDGAEGAEGGTLLPGVDVADVVADEEEGPVGLDEGLVAGVGLGLGSPGVGGAAVGDAGSGALLGFGAVGLDPGALVVRDAGPAT